MEWVKFKAHFPEEYESLELLAALQPESAPQEIDGNLRGAMKGQLVALLGEDGGRYFLKTLWGIEGGSTLKLSQTQGNMLKAWLWSNGNVDKLPGIVDAMRTHEAAQASAQISTERKAEAETEMQRVAREIGAKIRPLVDEEEPIDSEEEAARLLTLPEAPSSVNLFFSICGYNMQWTLRDVNDKCLLDRMMAHVALLEKAGAYAADRYGNPIPTLTSGAIAEAKQTPVTPARTAAPRQTQEDTSGVTLMPGEQAMRVIRIEVHTTKKGDPALHLFGPGREFADLYWNFGIDRFFEQCPEMQQVGVGENEMLFNESDLVPTLKDGKVVMPVYAGNWIAVWVESEKLNTKGFPYKNISQMYPA